MSNVSVTYEYFILITPKILLPLGIEIVWLQTIYKLFKEDMLDVFTKENRTQVV